jgi:hypothetical protein
VKLATLTGSENRPFLFLSFPLSFMAEKELSWNTRYPPGRHLNCTHHPVPPEPPATSGNSDVPAAHADSGPRPRTGVPFQYQDKSPETQRKMGA